MKTLEEVLAALNVPLDRETVEICIARTWVKPVQKEKNYYFEDIDLARLRLIQHLRRDMEVDDEAMDIVMSLLDQLYGAREQMRRMTSAIERLPRSVQADIFSLLMEMGMAEEEN